MNKREKDLMAKGKAENDNLNNLTTHKTRRVNDYIKKIMMDEPVSITLDAHEYSLNVKKKLATAQTNEEKLSLIGYRPNNYPTMFDKIRELNKTTMANR